MDLAYMAALPMEEFAQRRAKVFEQMQDDSLFLVFSDIERRRNDGCDYPFRQDSYFWYLTGFNEPNSALLLRKQQGEQQAIMFVRPSDKLLEIWNGRRLGVDNAPQTLLVDTAYAIDEFVPQFKNLAQKQTALSKPTNRWASKLESFKLLVKDKATAKISLGVVILTSVQNFGYYGIMIWMPNFLSKQLGFSLTKSGVWTAVTVCGMMAGIWIFGRLADRIGRKPSFLLFQAGAVVSIIAYSQLTDPNTMLIAGAFLGMFVNGMMGGYGALMAEAYPTQARATAQNVLFNLGRAVGGFGPVAVGAVVSAYSFQIAIAFLAVIYVIDMLATVCLVPELKGKELH